MNKILVGTSSWADRSLVENSKFYPPEINTPVARLQYYSERLPIAEIDSSYHFFPTHQNMALWLDNTPTGFIFDVRAFSLFTGQPTPLGSLPKSIREQYKELLSHRGNIYLHHLTPEIIDQLWSIFISFLKQIEAAGKLGAVLFQFPSWLHPNEDNFNYLIACRNRLPQYQLAIEFRTASWFSGKQLDETLAFLRQHQLALVCVDEPQGLSNSIPIITEITAPVGIIRFHGRNTENWQKKDIPAEERFNYLYSNAELQTWLPKVKRMAERAEKLHVIFKNKSHDFSIRNALEFTRMLNG